MKPFHQWLGVMADRLSDNTVQDFDKEKTPPLSTIASTTAIRDIMNNVQRLCTGVYMMRGTPLTCGAAFEFTRTVLEDTRDISVNLFGKCWYESDTKELEYWETYVKPHIRFDLIGE